MSAFSSAAGRRAAAWALLALLAIGLSGCSGLQLAYNNAHMLIHWRGMKYFGFEDEQKAEFDRRIERFVAWHRRSELPRFAKMADELANRLARGVSQADLVWGYDAAQGHLRQTLRAGAIELAGLLDTLSAEQIQRFQARLDKENRDFAKDHGLGEPPEERRAKRVKRNIERLEDWFGSLTDAQVERVVLYSRRAPLDDEARLKDRRRMQKELVALVAAREARKRVGQFAFEWDQHRDPAYEALRQENLKEYYSMLLDLDKSLSHEQRARAVKRLRGFAQDFLALAAQGAAP